MIAEQYAKHNESLENTIETRKAAKMTGAYAIKLQTYTADTMTINSDTMILRSKARFGMRKIFINCIRKPTPP